MKTVLITGINCGIGRATALTFLNKGFCVFGTSQSGTADYAHENLTVFALDLSEPQSVETCVREITEKDTPLNILINNAGVLLDEGDTTLVPEKLRATLEVNLIGTADFTERLVPCLAPRAHIIFISSTAGSLDRTGHLQSHYPGHYPAYKISKAALNMYMRTLAMRLKDEHVIVSSVHPGWVRTAMGGPDADLSPEEAGEDIATFAVSTPETGNFWFKGKQLAW